MRVCLFPACYNSEPEAGRMQGRCSIEESYWPVQVPGRVDAGHAVFP